MLVSHCGRTIAHRLSTVMDAGHIVERDMHAELIARDGHYAAMGRLQQQAAAFPTLEAAAL